MVSNQDKIAKYHVSVSIHSAVCHCPLQFSIVARVQYALDRIPVCDKRLKYNLKYSVEKDLEEKGGQAENPLNAFSLTVLSYY